MIQISIITITKDDESGLRRTLNSIINQNISPEIIELIVKSPVSIQLPDFIRNHKQIRLIENYDEDHGIYNAMNLALKLSSGKFVWFLNSGDEICGSNTLLMLSEKIKKNSNKKILIFNIIFTLNSQEIGKSKIESFNEIINLPKHQGVLIKRKFHLKYLYDESLKFSGDRLFFITIRQILKNHEIAFFNEIISKFDMNGVSNSKSINVIYKRKIESLKILRPYIGSVQKIKILFSIPIIFIIKNIFGQKFYINKFGRKTS